MKKWILILLAPVIALPLLVLLAAKAIAENFKKNLRKRGPGEDFGTKTDVTVYKNSPFPKAVEDAREYMKTIKREEVYTTSEDGLKLHAAFFPAEGPSKGFVIGIHGFQSFDWFELVPHISYYHSIGFHVLLPQDRAHGESEGDYVTMGVKDRRDCISWVHYLTDRFGEDSNILLHGVSMGGATVLSASGEEDLPKQVVGIVSDCGYTDAKAAFENQIQSLYHIPPAFPVKVCAWVAKHEMGYDLSEARPINQVKKARVPILFVQGEKDIMVPKPMVDALYEACSAPKKLFLVPNANHAESVALDPEGYHAAMEEMFHLKDLV